MVTAIKYRIQNSQQVNLYSGGSSKLRERLPSKPESCMSLVLCGLEETPDGESEDRHRARDEQS